MKRYVLYRLETGISDRLRTSSGKSTGKICLDRIYDGVTYLSCRANNVHPWYKWRVPPPTIRVHTYVRSRLKNTPFFSKATVLRSIPTHPHITCVEHVSLFLCSLGRFVRNWFVSLFQLWDTFCFKRTFIYSDQMTFVKKILQISSSFKK